MGEITVIGLFGELEGTGEGAVVSYSSIRFGGLRKTTIYLWYSDYGGETDVSLNCGRFYGPFVRPRMRMSEGVNKGE
jgi:hypothetical protein